MTSLACAHETQWCTQHYCQRSARHRCCMEMSPAAHRFVTSPPDEQRGHAWDDTIDTHVAALRTHTYINPLTQAQTSKKKKHLTFNKRWLRQILSTRTDSSVCECCAATQKYRNAMDESRHIRQCECVCVWACFCCDKVELMCTGARARASVSVL